MKIKPLKTKLSKEEKAKKEKQKIILAGLIMILLMVFSTVGYAILDGQFNDSQKIKYNGFEFTYNSEQGMWQTKTKISNQQKIIYAYFLPTELENLTSIFNENIFLSDFENKIVYFSINNTNNERTAAYLFGGNFGDYFLRAQYVCSEENALINTGFCSTLPTKSCENVKDNSEVLLIQLKEQINQINQSDENNKTNEILPNVSYSNNCLIIEGTGLDIIKLSQIAIFKAYGIME